MYKFCIARSTPIFRSISIVTAKQWNVIVHFNVCRSEEESSVCGLLSVVLSLILMRPNKTAREGE